MLRSPLAAAATVGLIALPTVAAAQTPPPQGVLNLSATATMEVTTDLMSVVLSTSRDGPDAGAVQSALKQALDSALAEAKRAAKPGQIDVQTGNFSLYPRYSSKGGITGWQGSAELIIEGKDMPAIAQLTGRIGTMTIARVGYGLSREQRQKIEGEVTGQAIASYRARAAETAKQFGYSGYTIREVQVSSDEPPRVMPMVAARAKAMSAADESLPIEPGKTSVNVTVSGSVQMMP